MKKEKNRFENSYHESEVWYKRIATELAAAVVIAFALWILDESQRRYSQINWQWVMPIAGFLISFAAIWFLTARKEKHSKSLYTNFLPFLSTPDNSVRLAYIVYEHADFSHCGECYIEVEDGQARITGQRHYMRDKSRTDELTVYAVRTSWHTEWCLICPDGYLRFLYNIEMPDEIVRGICEVFPSMGSAGKELVGRYERLYPAKLCEFAPRSGMIMFQVIGSDPVLPPVGARLASRPVRTPDEVRQSSGTEVSVLKLA